MASPGLFNTAYSDLVTLLQTELPTLRVVDDPRNINVPCLFVEAPVIQMASNVQAEMQFTLRVIGICVGDLKNLQKLLDIADDIRSLKIGLLSGRPTIATIGSQDYAAYDLQINTKIASE